MNTATFINDIPTSIAQAAYSGVSMTPERRAESTRSEYAQTLAEDYAVFHAQATKGGTLDLLDAEFDRYRAGYRARYHRFLHSNSRCVSSFIAGPSNFPAARMNKRADIAHKRLNEMFEFRARAMAAIIRTLRPDLAPIYASDSDALQRLMEKITKAETLQSRMKETNATIRRHAKAGVEAQVAALMVLGYKEPTARELLKPDFANRIGFANFELTNNNANIRRMKARIEQITKLQATPAAEIAGANARFEDAPKDNRVRLWFGGKPPEAVRSDLKSNGFRWTPSLGCWQAFRNWRATEAGKRIAGVVETTTEPTGLAATCKQFQTAVQGMAEAANLTPEAVYQLWKDYAKACSDQSALLWEFIQWYGKQLGGDVERLREIVRASGL